MKCTWGVKYSGGSSTVVDVCPSTTGVLSHLICSQTLDERLWREESASVAELRWSDVLLVDGN